MRNPLRVARILRLDPTSIKILEDTCTERKQSDYVNAAIQEKYLLNLKKGLSERAAKIGESIMKV
jgi:hypothetical protein